MLVLFPFEEAYFRERGVPATFVGHPAADEIQEVDRDAAKQQLSNMGVCASGEIVALLPGSRVSEIRHLAPVFTAGAFARSMLNHMVAVHLIVRGPGDRLIDAVANLAGSFGRGRFEHGIPIRL